MNDGVEKITNIGTLEEIRDQTISPPGTGRIKTGKDPSSSTRTRSKSYDRRSISRSRVSNDIQRGVDGQNLGTVEDSTPKTTDDESRERSRSSSRIRSSSIMRTSTNLLQSFKNFFTKDVSISPDEDVEDDDTVTAEVMEDRSIQLNIKAPSAEALHHIDVVFMVLTTAEKRKDL